jgi:hypothetical protein
MGAAGDWDGVGTSFVSVPSATLISADSEGLFGGLVTGCSTDLVDVAGDLASRIGVFASAGATFDRAGVVAAMAVPGVF